MPSDIAAPADFPGEIEGSGVFYNAPEQRGNPREVLVALCNTYGVAAPSISQTKSTGVPTGSRSAPKAPFGCF